MILYNFTEKQIHEELLKDMLNVMRFSDYKDKIFRRKVITAKMYPVRMSFFYTSPLKNRWFLAYEARSKKEFGDNVRMTNVCIYKDVNGFLCAAMIAIYKDVRVTLYPAHFFKRYKERMHSEKVGEELLKEYFTRNFSYVYDFEEKHAFNGIGNLCIKEVHASCNDGIAIGNVTETGNVFFKTFITYEMTKGEQIEKFAHNEKIRKEFENGE